MKKVKIVATIGPSTINRIGELIEKGVDIFRLNFSHSDHATHKGVIEKIREKSREIGRNVAILQDISGPKIRIGEIEGLLELKRGDVVTLAREGDEKDPYRLTISYPSIIDSIQEGEYVFFADGTIRTRVIEVGDGFVKLLVKNEGVLSSRKGVNFPNTNLGISAITPKDERDLRFGAKMGVDIVAISFVNRREDILKAREILREEGADPWVIAKIETKQAVENLEEILEVSDGVMVARGDLGIEVGIERVPIIQKKIIRKANRMKKPVITATQMLLSMVNSPYPTRAEVSDVANAVMDGSDGVMLSDETTVGKYPIRAVEILTSVILETQKIYPYYKKYDIEDSDAIAASVADLCRGLDVKGIVTFTSSGTTAKSIAKYRPDVDIFAVTHSQQVLNRLSMVWGIKPLFVLPPTSPDKLIELFREKVVKEGVLQKGDKIIVTMGSLVGKEGTTNMIRILEI